MAKSEDEKMHCVAGKLIDHLTCTTPKPTAKDIFLTSILEQTEKELKAVYPALARNKNIVCVGDSPEKAAPAYRVAKMYFQTIDKMRVQGNYSQNSDAIARIFTDVGFLNYKLEKIREQYE